jgi:hypothetical protein
MNADRSDPPTILDNATLAVRSATEAVQTTSNSLAKAIEAGRRPAGLIEQIAKLNREASISPLAAAFPDWFDSRPQRTNRRSV